MQETLGLLGDLQHQQPQPESERNAYIVISPPIWLMATCTGDEVDLVAVELQPGANASKKIGSLLPVAIIVVDLPLVGELLSGVVGLSRRIGHGSGCLGSALIWIE